MPLIIFVGISSLGALFLIVFLANLWREERDRGHGSAVRRARSAVRMVSQTTAERNQPSGLVVLRRTIECGEPERPTDVPGKQTKARVS
jgi:hypothetical protein